MTLRTRLLISVGGLLAVALLVSGALVVGLTRASLVDQLDDELRSAPGPALDRRGPGRGGGDPTGRRIAYLLLDEDGRVLQADPSGFDSRPDPLPSLPDLADAREGRLFGRIIERPSVDGSMSYRVLMQETRRDAIQVLAAPLTEVHRAIGPLVRNLLVVGGAVLAATLLLGWWLVRRDLRPLEAITGTADRISRGDLSQRVALRDDRSEVGRLGAAFDSMLDQIQTAFVNQEAALRAKEHSEHRLRQFVADASHELRTPLTVLRGYVDLDRAGGLEDPAAREQAMRRIGTESKRMAALVEDLLLLARLDQGRPLRRDPVDLSQLAADAVSDARAIEPQRPIAADVPTGVIVRGDEDRLRQVIGNLFTNVRVHTPADSPVHVGLSTMNGTCTLRVADRGPGVDPEKAERIFDRFYRADPARARDTGGSGLGLSIASSVVGAHGGSIEYVPTPGGGATFTVTLPVAADDSGPVPPTA